MEVLSKVVLQRSVDVRVVERFFRSNVIEVADRVRYWDTNTGMDDSERKEWRQILITDSSLCEIAESMHNAKLECLINELCEVVKNDSVENSSIIKTIDKYRI